MVGAARFAPVARGAGWQPAHGVRDRHDQSGATAPRQRGNEPMLKRGLIRASALAGLGAPARTEAPSLRPVGRGASQPPGIVTLG
jgi:hypothetical protein